VRRNTRGSLSGTTGAKRPSTAGLNTTTNTTTEISGVGSDSVVDSAAAVAAAAAVANRRYKLYTYTLYKDLHQYLVTSALLYYACNYC
jgi:hypothetical protein